MVFDERDEGDYRIFAGALEARLGDGYIAALIINRLRGRPGTPCEVYRDEGLACGHRWATADAALSFALQRGQQLVSSASAGAAPRPDQTATGALMAGWCR